jgi:hypothetical protein
MRNLVCLTLLVGLACAPAHASTIFFADLTGAQEVPPVSTPATGFSRVVLNDTEDMILVSLTFANLTTPQTAAHIHGPALPGVNAGILIGFPLGTFSDLPFTITPTQVNWLKTGQTYVNVHSQQYPGGEIRGQLAPIPEPGTAVLFVPGLAAALFAGSKLRRKRA